MFVAFLVSCGSLCYAQSPANLTLTPDERRVETEWLTSLGLNVPEGGLLLEHPYAAPLTKRSLLAPSAWWHAPQPTEVVASQFRDDVAVLHTVMEKAYGGWESAAARGWDWPRFFSDWDASLVARGDAKLLLVEALEPFQRLEQVQLDNHSGPVGGKIRLGSGSRTAVLEAAPAGVCTALRMEAGGEIRLYAKDPAQLAKPAKIVRARGAEPVDGYYVSYPQRRGLATAVQCGGEWIPLAGWPDGDRDKAIEALAQKSPDEPSYRTIGDAIGYLRVPSGSKENNELFRKLLPVLPAFAGHERLLIVDLRQNDGGDNALNLMTRWLDVAAIRSLLKFNRRQPKSCVYDALRWGYTQMTSQNLKAPLSNALKRSLQGQLDALFEAGTEGCPVTVDNVRSDYDYRKRDPNAAPSAGKPRLMLLADNGCGSDCELMVNVLGGLPGTVVVGESTFGVAQFIQPGYFILPRTRLQFRIATGTSDIYGDGRSVDGYGLGPDIVLAGPDAQSAESVLRLAQHLAGR